MFDIGPAEFLLLLVLAVILFGPERLPELARKAARMIRYVVRWPTTRNGSSRTNWDLISPTWMYETCIPRPSSANTCLTMSSRSWPT